MPLQKSKLTILVNLNLKWFYLGAGDAFLDCGGGERPRLDESVALSTKEKKTQIHKLKFQKDINCMQEGNKR